LLRQKLELYISIAAERMSAKIIDFEGYEKIDPQSPTGGPDDVSSLKILLY
jgi:hypothetical protein